MATFDLGRIAPLYKGGYNASTSYELNDVVHYNGNLYWHIQVKATIGVLPTDTNVWKTAFDGNGIRTEIIEYAQTASASAQSAEVAKTAAQTAEASAQGFAQTASQKASEAAESAVQAQKSVTDAQAEVTRASAEADRARAEAEQAASRIYDLLPTDSASGAVASFMDGADNVPLKSLVVGINLVQSGEGDPSPENIRPITGWTGMTVNANGTEIPISWESEAGTVYGGSLDVLTGLLTVDRVKETFVFNNPTEDGTYNLESQRFNLTKRSTGASNSTGKITNVCGAYAYAQASWHNGEPHFYVGTTSWTLYLTKDTYRGGNVELCYPLETPLTYQLTPHEVKSLLGTNNIYANTGDTSVEYRADIKAYINRKIAEAIAALS